MAQIYLPVREPVTDKERMVTNPWVLYFQNLIAQAAAAGAGTVTNAATLTANQLVIGQGTNAVATLGSLGTTTTVLHGNAAGAPSFGAVVEADITLAANTTNNVSITKHGFTPVLPNDATKYLDGTGAYTVPSATSGGGAPDSADYLVETAQAGLSAEVVTGTTYMTTAAYASRQAAAKAGRLFLPNNSYYYDRDTGSAWASWAPIFPVTPPVDADFAWFNQGSATVNTTNGGVYLEDPGTAGDHFRIREKSIGANTTLILAGMPNAMGVGAVSPGYALSLRESGTGKICVFRYVFSGQLQQIFIQRFTDADGTGGNNELASLDWLPQGHPLVWMKVVFATPNWLFSLSADGQHWIQIKSLAQTTPFTTAADKWGFAVDSNQATYACGVTIVSFKES